MEVLKAFVALVWITVSSLWRIQGTTSILRKRREAKGNMDIKLLSEIKVLQAVIASDLLVIALREVLSKKIDFYPSERR